MQYVHLTEKRIPEDQWVEPLLRDEGIYDGDMLKLMRKIRCKRDPRHFECVDKAE